MWKYVLNKMIKQKEATFFIVMIILSFAVSSAAPYLNGKFIDLLTVSKDIHLIVQFALIIVGVGVVGALISYCSNLTTVKVLTKTTMASIYEGMDNLLETDLVIAEKLDFSYITQRLFQDANVITSFVLSNFLSIFLNGILIVGVLYCFFVIDPLLCLIVVVVLIPYIVLFLALKRPLFDSSEKKKEADSRLFGSIHSIVEQVFSIQLNSRFSGAKKEAQASFTNCFPFILKAGRLSYLFSSIDSIIQTVFQSVLFIFAGIQIAVGNMTVGEFVMINSYFAGLDGIQFSLDGLRDSHERLRNKVGIFPKVIDAMKYVLNETGLRLSIAFTPTSFNVKDFLGVYDLLVDLYEKSNRTTGSDYIDFRLQPLMLLGRAKDNPNIVPTDAQYRWLVQNINEVNLTGKCHPCIDVKWGDPIDHLVRFRDTNYFMDQVSVHANGDIVVSAYLPLVVGNVRKRSLSDYWNAGLKTIWATNVVQYLTARMQSVRDMENITTLISDINMDGCLNLDLMENDLNDLNLIKGVILEEWM